MLAVPRDKGKGIRKNSKDCRMTTIKAFIMSHPVVSYYVFAFAIS